MQYFFIVIFSTLLAQNSADEKLLTAIRDGNTPAALLALQSGALVNGTSDQARPLIAAAYNKRVAITKVLLEHGADVNILNQRGSTALMIAANYAHDSLFNILIQAKPDLNIEAKNGYKTFDYCLESGKDDFLRQALFLWIEQLYPTYTTFIKDINEGKFQLTGKISSYPKQVLSFAAVLASINNDVPSIEKLYTAGFSLNSHNQSGYTALTISARFGKLDILKALVSQFNANIGIGNDGNDEASPFIQAARGGQLAIGQYLIDQGVDVNKQNGRGYTALTACIWYQRDKFIELIMENGGNPNIRAMDGLNTIDYAYTSNFKKGIQVIADELAKRVAKQSNQQRQLEAYFLDQKKTFHPKGDRFQSALLASAILREDAAFVQMLLSSGVDPNQQTPLGYYPVSLASVWNKELSILDMLLKSGVNVALKNNDHFESTALMLASRDGDIRKAKRLISAGLDLNDVDKFNDSAINWAVMWGKLDYVKLLLESGAKTHFIGHDSKDNALDIAKRQGFKKITEVLIEHGARSNRRKNLETFLNAVENKNEAEALALIEKGIVLNGLEADRRPLLQAIAYGQSNAALKLLAEGADPNSRNAEGVTPLMMAAIAGDSAVFNKLFQINLTRVTDVMVRLYNCFDYAIYSGNAENVKRFFYSYLKLRRGFSDKNIQEIEHLIENNRIEPNFKFLDEFYFLAILNDSKAIVEKVKALKKTEFVSLNTFTIASMLDRKKIREYLLGGQFDFFKTDVRGMRPIDFIDINNANYPIVLEKMIEQKAKTEQQGISVTYQPKIFKNYSDTLQRLLFLQGLLKNQKNMVQQIIKNGFNINRHAINGSTFLSNAARLKNEGLVKLLLANAAQIEQRNTNRFQTNALMEAASAGDVSIGKLLLENGADIDEVDINNDPALNYAVFYGYTDFVAMLLEKGADFRKKGQSSFTPLMTAKARNFQKIIKLLKEAELKK